MGAQQSRGAGGGGEDLGKDWSVSYEGHNRLFEDSWSSLPREVIVDKIRGLVFGQAIGDALGLATEFMNKQEAEAYYGASGPKSYDVIVQDFHRSRWRCGDWTDDTDQMILILVSLANNLGKAIPSDLAQRLLAWKQNGFQEFGDLGGMGIGLTTVRVLSSAKFVSNPHQAAVDVWEASGRYLAANGAVMRTSICGAANFNDLEKVLWQTREFCLVTHADPRCVASCAVVTVAIALMLRGEYDACDKKGVEALIKHSCELAERALGDNPTGIADFHKHIKAKAWKDLKLDDHKTIGYTYKAMGAGVFGLRTSTDFRKTITELVMEAGDADSNAAVCGALLGCKFGYSGLPKDLVDGLVYHDWLYKLVDRFLAMIGLHGEAKAEVGKATEPPKQKVEKTEPTDSGSDPKPEEATEDSKDDIPPPATPADDVAEPVSATPADDGVAQDQEAGAKSAETEEAMVAEPASVETGGPAQDQDSARPVESTDPSQTAEPVTASEPDTAEPPATADAGAADQPAETATESTTEPKESE